MTTYLIFRTDRIGDFLLTVILINSIKRNDPNSYITVVSSTKNYDFIKSFKFVNEVIMLKNGLIGKIKLIHRLRSLRYDTVIVHDAKNRSSIISKFLKYKLKIDLFKESNISYIGNIKKILNQLDFTFLISDLNTLDNRNYSSSLSIDDNFILFHFDEKWIYKDYISEYTNIEPTKVEFVRFINLLLSASNKTIVITTGAKCPKMLDDLIKHNFGFRVKILKALNFLDLENVVSKCKLLISCHGSISHIAAAHNIKQIDIIEKKKLDFYHKWTEHFRSYFPIYRIKFDELSNKIIGMT